MTLCFVASTRADGWDSHGPLAQRRPWQPEWQRPLTTPATAAGTAAAVAVAAHDADNEAEREVGSEGGTHLSFQALCSTQFSRFGAELWICAATKSSADRMQRMASNSTKWRPLLTLNDVCFVFNIRLPALLGGLRLRDLFSSRFNFRFYIRLGP